MRELDVDDMLIGVATREIAMHVPRRGMTKLVEVGAEVEVSSLPDGWLRVRLPGTFWEQRVHPTSVACP